MLCPSPVARAAISSRKRRDGATPPLRFNSTFLDQLIGFIHSNEFLMASRIALPSSFSHENTLPPTLDLRAGAQSHIFQPPTTPSASNSLYKSTLFPSNEHGRVTTSRKRTRQDISDEAGGYSSISNVWTPTTARRLYSSNSPGIMSPAPLVNTKYFLAGGLDTPTTKVVSALDKGDVYPNSPDLALRGGRNWDQSECINENDYLLELSAALSREANGRSRLHRGPSAQEGWGETIYSVVGKVGRMWSFCKKNAFRGFYAGGGQGFQKQPPEISRTDGESIWEESEDKGDTKKETSSISGWFPEEDFIPDYMSQDHTLSPRPAKKIQLEKGEGDLRASWIKIDNESTSRESSPTRIAARKMPRINSPGRRPLSRAGCRPTFPTTRSSQTSFAGSLGLRSDRPTSFALTRSPVSVSKHGNPAQIEVQRHAARIKRQEMEDDAYMKRLNRQLKAMIKEGKEALGTKFEVEELDETIDEGYAEGD